MNNGSGNAVLLRSDRSRLLTLGGGTVNFSKVSISEGDPISVAEGKTLRVDGKYYSGTLTETKFNAINGKTPELFQSSDVPEVVDDTSDIKGLTFNDAGNYYEINDAQDLVDLATYFNDGNDCAGLTFKVTANIDLGTIDNFTPIGGDCGDKVISFKGTFNGNNKTISNLTVNGDYYAGLFGYVSSNGTIKNVILTNATVSGNKSVGGIVGNSYSGKITNCKVNAQVSDSTNYAGGIIGLNQHAKVSDNIYRSNKDAVGYNFEGTVENNFRVYTNLTFTDDLDELWGVSSGRDGSKANPYLISSIDGLKRLSFECAKALANNSDYGSGKYFKLTADIDGVDFQINTDFALNGATIDDGYYTQTFGDAQVSNVLTLPDGVTYVSGNYSKRIGNTLILADGATIVVNVSYVDTNGETQTVNAIVLTGDTTNLSAGTYVVLGDVTKMAIEKFVGKKSACKPFFLRLYFATSREFALGGMKCQYL